MKKKMFGAILCSAALAVGMSMPAFAVTDGHFVDNADEKVTNTETQTYLNDINNDSDKALTSTGETEFVINTDITQISAEVPMKVAIYAETGGGTLGVPSAGTYKVTNKSAKPLYITKIIGNGITANDWSFKGNSISAADIAKKNGDVKYGNIQVMMKFTPTDGTNKDVEQTKYVSDSGIEAFTPNVAKLAAYDSANTSQTDNSFAFDFSGSNGVLNQSIAEADLNKTTLFKLTYTVSLTQGMGGVS